MTLTNQTGMNATETVHQDHRPGNRVLPNGQVVSEEMAILLDKSIVAKPLTRPAQEEIRIKNFGFKYRWVNRLGQGGSWYMRQKMSGWTNATLEDVDPMSVELTTDGTGEIRMFDTVLMKLPLGNWQSAIKNNMVKALRLQNDKRYLTGQGDKLPSTDVFSDDKVAVHTVASETDRAVSGGQYVKSFEVSPEELDSKMGKDKAGRK